MIYTVFYGFSRFFAVLWLRGWDQAQPKPQKNVKNRINRVPFNGLYGLYGLYGFFVVLERKTSLCAEQVTVSWSC